MEYSFDQYKRNTGKVYTSSDGYKYFCHKSIENILYLGCVLFRKGCKGSAKLEKATNLIYPKSEHNHGLQDYRAEVYAIKTKCKTTSQTSQHNLRHIFNDVTRSNPSASQVTFKECESSMFRARKILQPMIPQSASEFSEVLPTTTFAVNHKATVIVDVGRHAIPAIHCLLTNKDDELYVAVIQKIRELVPQLEPDCAMSDWEQAARNAVKRVYPGIRVNGCWFHYTQAIWRKTQKYGLASTCRGNSECASFVKKIMAIPFLPAELILPIYNLLQIPTLQQSQMKKLEVFLNYFEKQWLTKIGPEELSIFNLKYVTNNAAESYHGKLKSIIKSSHPRIWNFLIVINNTIADYDNEMARIQEGREITRPRKKKNVMKNEHRKRCKEKLLSGSYSPIQFLERISCYIGNATSLEDTINSDDSDMLEEPESFGSIETNKCVVCLQTRSSTWVFMPCRHANCCTQCSDTIDQLQQTCPTCRGIIEGKFQIFLN
ncbi:hypothetical protein LOD99_860 [Oopsacas minuta]|uniref:RING-type domain-containing protein n=1 Tax=Oopsacas minuta TaxID=111878 RepID=A0AAV7JZS2_9METZ|nr:hypothetical protein LOD99_860 [Oopsacas minuta]